jgi:hypothetical protein
VKIMAGIEILEDWGEDKPEESFRILSRDA